MGKPKFSRKKFETPSHPWQEARIQEENELVTKYGLKNKKEIWKAETRLRRYRSQARELLASISTGDEQSKKESKQLIDHLSRINILPPNSTLDDVLALETESILSRRLQTITYLKGFSSTPKQARQLISHGHVAVNGRKVTVPGYIVTKSEEGEIDYTGDSPLNDAMHPARPKSDFKSFTKKKTEKQKEEKPKEEKEKKEDTGKKDEKVKEEKPKKETENKEEKKEEKPEPKTEEKPKETKENNKPEEKKVEEKENNKPEEVKEEKKTEEDKGGKQ
jgi:small subunit ribosomal protein S4